MKVLVISPLFPPLADSESFCGGKFVQGLIDSGIEPQVIYCPTVTKTTDSSSYWEPLREFTTAIPNPSREHWLLQASAGARYQTTSYVGWTRVAMSTITILHRKHKFDLIVSRSLPWFAHLTGYWAASALRLPWVAQFGDPWDLRPFMIARDKVANWDAGLNVRTWMRRTLATADLVTFPCRRVRDYCIREAHRRGPISIIPHIGVARNVESNSSEFLLVHAGKLGVNELTARPATALLEGLVKFFDGQPAAKERTRLVLVGPEDIQTKKQSIDMGLGDNVRWVGRVSYEKSLEQIAQASVCVLVEGPFAEGIFLPSKVCDYVAARKPTLALSPEIGTVADLAREQGILRVSPESAEDVGMALSELYQAFMNSDLTEYLPSASLINRFESKTIIQSFIRSCTQLIGKDGSSGVVEKQGACLAAK